MPRMPQFQAPVFPLPRMKCAAVVCVLASCAHAAVQMIPGNKRGAASKLAGRRTSTMLPYPPNASNMTKVYTNLSADMVSFYDKIRDLHRAHLEDLTVRRFENEHVLDEQQMTALIKNSSNAKIQATVLSLDDDIRNLHSQAVDIQLDIMKIQKEFANLNTNLSAAIDFAGRSMATFRDVKDIVKVPKKDHKAAKPQARHVQAYRGKRPQPSAVRDKLVLFQISADSKDDTLRSQHADGPTDVWVGAKDVEEGFQHVHLEVKDLAKLHARHLAIFERDLKVRFDEGTKDIAELVHQQKQLNITHSKLKSKAPEVVRAVQDLGDTRAFLLHQFIVLGIFLRDMSNHTAVLDHIEQRFERKLHGGSLAPSIGGSLNLLQSGAKPRRKAMGHTAKDLDLETDVAFRGIVGQVSELESELLHNRAVTASAFQSEYTKFQDLLAQQSQENVRLAHVNSDMVKDLNFLRTHNANLQDHARALNKQIMLVGKDVAGAQASLTVAQSFITDTLQQSSAKSNHSFMLLTEMEAEDRAPVEAQEHADAVAAIRDAWTLLVTPVDDDLSNALVLLDTGLGSVTPGHPKRREVAPPPRSGRARLEAQAYEDALSAEEMIDAPSDFLEIPYEDTDADVTGIYPKGLTTVEAIMSSMQANLHMLTNARVTNMLELQETYQAAMDVCKHSKVRLQGEYDGLNAMMTSATDANKKILAAVVKLDVGEAQLLTAARSLRTYVGTLGKDSTTQNVVVQHALQHAEGHESLSLLQMASHVTRRAKEPLKAEGDASAMADAGEGFGGKAFRSVASRASALQQKLQEMDVQNKERLAAHNAEYEQRLAGMADANKKLSSSLQDIQGQNQNIYANCMRLRKQSVDLTKDCEVLTSDLAALQGNFSKAMDFLTTSLHDVNSKKTPELAVLGELDEQDRVNTAHRDKQRRLGEIASSAESRPQTSLLQITSIETPQALLRGLEGSVGELGDEYESLASAAKSTFQTDAHRLREEHARLLSAKDAKLAENQSLQQLQKRLTAAVVSLEAKRDTLEDRSRSLRSFTKRLSGREAPELLTKPRHNPQLENATASLPVQSTPVTALSHVMESLLQVPHAPKQLPEQSQQADATVSSPIGAGKLISWFTR